MSDPSDPSNPQPRHLARGGGRRSRETPPGPEAAPPRLRESERRRERMRAQRGSGDDLPPMPTRPPDPRKERRLPGWLVPAILGTVAVLAAAGALMLDRDTTAEAVGSAQPVTPVFSARRVPEVLTTPVANERLKADLTQWLTGVAPNSCLVVRAGGENVFAQNADAKLAGASTQKLVTGTAALLELGPDTRFTTIASVAAPPVNGVVEGDLYIIGGGDPVLTTPEYSKVLYEGRPPSLQTDPKQLVDQIKAAGITQINGSIIGDGSHFDDQRFNPIWPPRFRDGSQNVLGNVGALMVDDGYESFPLDQYVSANARTPAANPAEHAAGEFARLLREANIQINGAPKAGTAPAGTTLTTVATLESPTVAQIVGEMLVESDNETAEMLLKELGVRETGSGTYAAGAAAASKILGEAGVTAPGKIIDGSGLSLQNEMSCQLLMELITRPDTGPMLVERSSIAGETGTLAKPFAGTPIAGKLHAKTGTLPSVNALAGRADPAHSGSILFAFITNVPEPSRISDARVVEQRSTLAEILVGYPRGIDVDALLPTPIPPS